MTNISYEDFFKAASAATDLGGIAQLNGYDATKITLNWWDINSNTGSYSSATTGPSSAKGSTVSQVTVETTMPPTEPVAEPSPLPYSYISAQIDRVLNRGWNTSARTVAPLTAGSYLWFNVMDGITGAFIGIGATGRDGKQMHLFDHGLVVSLEGVRVIEGGEVKQILRSAPSSLSSIRIYRQPDNVIVYTITTGTETVVYKSLVTQKIGRMFNLYAYCKLYSSGDRVTDAAFAQGSVGFGEV